MQSHSWIKSFPASITVCDTNGIILEMNDASGKEFETDGGLSLIGTNVLDCHPEPSRTKLQVMLATQNANFYMVEKRGKRKMVCQTPWFHEGKYAGFIEMIIPLPQDLPLIVRE